MVRGACWQVSPSGLFDSALVSGRRPGGLLAILAGRPGGIRAWNTRTCALTRAWGILRSWVLRRFCHWFTLASRHVVSRRWSAGRCWSDKCVASESTSQRSPLGYTTGHEGLGSHTDGFGAIESRWWQPGSDSLCRGAGALFRAGEVGNGD